jgi:hypothetical protein
MLPDRQTGTELAHSYPAISGLSRHGATNVLKSVGAAGLETGDDPVKLVAMGLGEQTYP